VKSLVQPREVPVGERHATTTVALARSGEDRAEVRVSVRAIAPTESASAAELARLVSKPERRPQPHTRKRLLAVALGVTLLAAAVPFGHWVRARSVPRARTSPLAAGSSVLACPQLEAAGVEAPTGWLGAAAAAVACRRVRWLLGGSPARTLSPASLLDVPPHPVEGATMDRFGASDARQRELVAAKVRAQAYLDGAVAKLPTGFRVELTLRSNDGTSIAAAGGEVLSEDPRYAPWKGQWTPCA
jgi:hypothetical protein